jgi:hypothetical protein
MRSAKSGLRRGSAKERRYRSSIVLYFRVKIRMQGSEEILSVKRRTIYFPAAAASEVPTIDWILSISTR